MGRAKTKRKKRKKKVWKFRENTSLDGCVRACKRDSGMECPLAFENGIIKIYIHAYPDYPLSMNYWKRKYQNTADSRQSKEKAQKTQQNWQELGTTMRQKFLESGFLGMLIMIIMMTMCRVSYSRGLGENSARRRLNFHMTNKKRQAEWRHFEWHTS